MKDGKLKLYLLYIFTFGIAYFYLRNQAKKLKGVENDQLTLSEEIPIDVDKLIEYLGKEENIVSTSNTISSIKIFVRDLSKIETDKIKKLGVKGLIKGKDYISFIFGDFSHLLKSEIDKKITTN
ncbi:MAG: hypothetical protein ACRDCD_01010 [Mycoplasmoidaceae bacterium]